MSQHLVPSGRRPSLLLAVPALLALACGPADQDEPETARASESAEAVESAKMVSRRFRECEQTDAEGDGKSWLVVYDLALLNAWLRNHGELAESAGLTRVESCQDVRLILDAWKNMEAPAPEDDASGAAGSWVGDPTHAF